MNTTRKWLVLIILQLIAPSIVAIFMVEYGGGIDDFYNFEDYGYKTAEDHVYDNFKLGLVRLLHGGEILIIIGLLVATWILPVYFMYSWTKQYNRKILGLH